MKKLILHAFLFIGLLSVSGSSYAIDFIKFGTGHDADFWGTPNSEFGVFPSTVQFLAAKGRDQITSLELTDENVEDVFNGDFGSFDAIVVSENIPEELLSPESYALFNRFVSAGGCFILTGDHANDEDEFLNNAFGYNVTVSDTADGVDTFSIRPGAGGTQFAGGPALLISANETAAFGNTPGTTIYSGSTGVTVFTDNFGSGIVNVIGWDYCCTPPDSESAILAWYEVVNRAFSQCGFPEEIATIPTLSEWGMIAMAGVLGIFGLLFALRRRKITA